MARSRAAGRAIAVAAGAALLLATSPDRSPARAMAPGSAAHGLSVTAFQEAVDPNSLITRSAGALAIVGVDGVGISADGARVEVPDATLRRSLAVAHRDHLRAELLVANWDNRIGDFSEAYAHHLLSSPTHIAAVAASLARSVRRQGWDGVSVDLESLHARDRAGLVSFLQALRAGLPAGKSLSVCITSYRSLSVYRATGYDLPKIARTVSRVVLMAYDEHGPWENTPGPVGALGWQRAGLKALLRYVPARKVDLGQAGYGYAWRPHSNDMVSDPGARELVAANGVTARWVANVGEWTAHLPDGSTLWWADARSYRLRVSIARNHHLHGLAIWDLALSDPIS